MAEVLEKPIEIFYSGNHVDSTGKKVKVSDAEVTASVADFNASGERLPMVPGHPSDDSPAGGYATKLAVVGGRVSAIEAEDLNPMFRAIVNSGELNRVSVKLQLPGHPSNPTKNYRFRHIGFLGRSRPALDQLKSAQFSRHDGEIILMAYEDDLKTEAEAKFAAMEAEFAKREADLAAQELAFKKAREYEPYLEGLVREGKLTPAQKQPFITVFSSLPDTQEVEFTEGEKQSAPEFLKGFLNGLPQQVIYAEVSKAEGQSQAEAAFKAMDDKEPDGDELAMHNAIVASGVDPTKDSDGYQRAVKKAMAKGGK